MLIGNVDISTYHAKQFKETIEHAAIENESEWNAGSPIPSMVGGTTGFKKVTIVLEVRGEGREDIIKNCSNILSQFLEPAVVTLDRFSHKFFLALTKHSRSESTEDIWHLLTLECEGYEFGAEVSQNYTGTAEITVNNPGNLVTPVVLEITPTMGASSITVKGISRSGKTATIKNLTTGKKIILDGETGLFTEDGALKAGDIEIWEVPTLAPGNNVIQFSTDNLNVSVKIKPRYM